MEIGRSMVEFPINRPKFVTGIMVFVTLLLLLVAGLPTIWPDTFSALNPMEVDTDPENMLPEDEVVRVFHNEMKREMSLYDIVVLGVVNEAHPDGVFNPDSLSKIYELTQYAKTLRWPAKHDPDENVGVVEVDMIAPSTVDNIEQGGPGVVKFEWLMPSPPKTRDEALAIRRKAQRIPFLEGTLISEDGKALSLYLPLTSKDVSHKIYSKLSEKISEFTGDEKFYITGLPVAEDTFGVEMFKQMAISAPIAMAVIFLLMLLFFRKLVLIISPMIVAMVSAICTMGVMIATGNTVHIMSSMIPIFIIPIAVLDAIHILSDFFDQYQKTKDRRKTILAVMDELFSPMLYTSITTAVGFASLALTPIPPVRVFGLFVALGVMAAWIWTITFIPAYIMFIPNESLRNFGTVHTKAGHGKSPLLTRFLFQTGRLTYRNAKLIVFVAGIIAVLALYGISRININDNPVKWFTPGHPIRVADRILNKHFGGTYMAYLALESEETEESPRQHVESLSKRLMARGEKTKEMIPPVVTVFNVLREESERLGQTARSKEEFFDQLEAFVSSEQSSAPEDHFVAWDEALLFIDEERQREQVFKQPDALTYVAQLQDHLLTTGVVGKSNSLSDIVKTVYRELVSGEDKDFKIPESANAVAQSLITYQSSHRPQDLWHFVTPDYKKAVIWGQLKSGDNRDMSKVAKAVDQYIAANPSELPLSHQWFGLTYINVIWQKKMVFGMLQAFLGSFLAVFLMMTLLYRSALWGMLCMIPLTLTIALIYGIIGLVGKDYDMPVAILSSLSLGLAVDYAIHFLSRSRRIYESKGSWTDTVGPVFGEPARAISRNIIVVGTGFLPLLLAPLVPYQTVGIFIASILLVAGVATLFILPSLIPLLEKWLFPETPARAFMCNCTTVIAAGVAAIALIVVNARQLLSVGWAPLTWFSIGGCLTLVGVCFLIRRREKCKPKTG
jgi:predicted RND superfamily exporter protein